MSEAQNPGERLRELAKSLNLSFDEIVGDLLSPSAPPASADAPAALGPFRVSEAAIRAAISDSYSASEIQAADGEREILEQSEVIMIGGRRRLRLSDSARAVILREAAGNERFGALLNQAIASDKQNPSAIGDEVESRSVCLRRFLNGEASDLASASPAELRPAVAALERLRDVTTLASVVPSLSDTRRLLERAELLEPLRISIGATGGWNDVPKSDRFVGRERELRLLRSFVDEIASESTLETVQRGVSNYNQAIRRRLGDERVQGVRFLVALGGLGKSALIAKFVLDHALRQSRSFPFAYLDFDRAAIQARDPRHLLLEVARQVALQFPAIGRELGELRERIRESISGMASSTADTDPFDEFRELVRRHVTFGERALLVVLDTVEIVQCDAQAMKGLLAFLERLSRGGFTELRIVAAGRAEVPDLLAGTRSRHEGVAIKLEPLSRDEARDMVQRLGTALLPSQWRDEWTTRLAGSESDPPERREPLSLRVAVEAIRDEAPDKRDWRSREIEALGEDADASFVGKLYENRVVGHVAGGEDVRRLAWPGLVVRRVSVEIIRDLLAPQLGLDPARAQEVFDALASQVWIVVRDGNTLRHQQDLRSRTLPLMRRKPEFEKINKAAIEYFGARQARAVQDRAEWIYHRLIGGESPTAVDADWTDSLVPFLKDAHEDFPASSPAAAYLAARTSDRLLPDGLLARLDPRQALLHIARAGLQKGSLADRTIDPVLVTLQIASIPPTTLTGSAEAARVSLLVKTGRWTAAEGEHVADVDGSWQQHALTAIAFRRARMMSPGSESGVALPLAAAYSGPGASERAPLAALIQDLAASRIRGLPIAGQLDDMLTQRLGRGVSMTDATIGLPMLRTVMLFGSRAIVPAARLWIAQIIEQVRASEQLAFSSRELLALSSDDQLQPAVRRALETLGQSWEEFLSLTSSPDDRTRVEDPMLAAAVCDALRRRCDRADPDQWQALRVFAAARDEDWLTPLAYAAHRATGGKIPKEMADLYETHLPVARGFLQRRILSRIPVPVDVLEALRRADEASDVVGACQLFARSGDPNNAGDLHALLEWHHAWRTGVQRVLSEPSGLAGAAV